MKTLLFHFLILFAVGWSCFTLDAQVFETAAINMEGRAVGSILDDADRRANQLLAAGESTANRIVTNASVEMSILVQSLRASLNQDLNQKLDRIDVQEQNAFHVLNELIQEANAGVGRIENIEDNLSVDFSRRLEVLPFVSKRPIFISRVRGLYQTHRSLDYAIEVSGRGFGTEDNAQYEVFVSTGVNNKNNLRVPQEQFAPSPTNKNGLLVRIPNYMFEEAYLPTATRRVSLFIKAKTGKAELGVTLPVFLLPTEGATLTITPIVNQDMRVSVPLESEFDHTLQGNGTGGSLFLNETHLYPPEWIVTGVRFDNDGAPGCPYCSTDSGAALSGNITQTWENHPNEHFIRLHMACHGTLCTNKWFVKFDKIDASPGAGATQTKPVSFGESVSFDLPPRTVDWRLEGNFYNRKPFVFKKGERSPYFLEGSTTPIGSFGQRVVITLQNPFVVTN